MTEMRGQAAFREDRTLFNDPHGITFVTGE